MSEANVDCVYVAASAHDARFTRTCVASIRRFYPAVPIRLLAGGPVQRGLLGELWKYWKVEPAAVTSGDYGWGFVKLEPLFASPGERFLVLDSDTVLTGPVIDLWRKDGAPFLVDDEEQTEADTRSLYYDWDKIRKIDPDAARPHFVFNSGQWFGTAGVLTRDDFSQWLEWTMPRRLRYPAFFMPGEQGVLNYVLNRKVAAAGLAVRREKIMRWPGHSMVGLSADKVADGSAQPLIVHWAGVKKYCFSCMAGSDILTFFERHYYGRMPMGALRRLAGLFRSFGSDAMLRLRLRFVQRPVRNR